MTNNEIKVESLGQYMVIKNISDTVRDNYSGSDAC